MKKLIFSFLLLSTLTTGIAQDTKSDLLTREEYLRKSRSQRTIGWILLPLGGAALTIGSMAYAFEMSLDASTNVEGLIAALSGAAVVLTSYILFRASAKNKRLATALSFDFKAVPGLDNQVITSRHTPSINLRWRF